LQASSALSSGEYGQGVASIDFDRARSFIADVPPADGRLTKMSLRRAETLVARKRSATGCGERAIRWLASTAC
jgi:hypothetical protein